MYVYMYVYMYMYVYTYIHTYICTYTYVYSVYIYIYIHIIYIAGAIGHAERANQPLMWACIHIHFSNSCGRHFCLHRICISISLSLSLYIYIYIYIYSYTYLSLSLSLSLYIYIQALEGFEYFSQKKINAVRICHRPPIFGTEQTLLHNYLNNNTFMI